MDAKPGTVNIHWGTTVIGTPKHSRNAMAVAPKETEIDTPIISNIIMALNKITAVMTYPPFLGPPPLFP